MEETRLDNVILALLFASDEPLSAKKIAGIVDGAETGDIRDSVKRLATRVETEFPSVMLENVAGGWQLATNPDYADYVALLYSGRRKQRLSKAGLETLAIIAYKQPVTRADIENVRGVSCGGVITTLMERTLIRIVGKAKVLGAPFLYGTTQEFLEYLGINSLKDLPSMEELEELLAKEESAEAGDAESDAASGDAKSDAASGDGEPPVGRGASEPTLPGAVVTAHGAEVRDVADSADSDEEPDDAWQTQATQQEDRQLEDSSDPVQTDK